MSGTINPSTGDVRLLLAQGFGLTGQSHPQPTHNPKPADNIPKPSPLERQGTFDNVEEAEEADDSVVGRASSTFLNNVLKVNGINVPQGPTTKPAHEKPKVAGSIAAVGAQLLPHFQNRVNGLIQPPTTTTKPAPAPRPLVPLTSMSASTAQLHQNPSIVLEQPEVIEMVDEEEEAPGSTDNIFIVPPETEEPSSTDETNPADGGNIFIVPPETEEPSSTDETNPADGGNIFIVPPETEEPIPTAPPMGGPSSPTTPITTTTDTDTIDTIDIINTTNPSDDRTPPSERVEASLHGRVIRLEYKKGSEVQGHAEVKTIYAFFAVIMNIFSAIFPSNFGAAKIKINDETFYVRRTLVKEVLNHATITKKSLRFNTPDLNLGELKASALIHFKA